MPLSPDAAIVVMRLMGGKEAREEFDQIELSTVDEGLKNLRDLIVQDVEILPWYTNLSVDRRLRAWDAELEPLFQLRSLGADIKPGVVIQAALHLFWILRDALIATVLMNGKLDEYLCPLARYRVGLAVLGIDAHHIETSKEAYHRWESRRHHHGDDWADWFEAEKPRYADLHAHLGASVPFDRFWCRWLTGHSNPLDMKCQIPEEDKRELWKVVEDARGILKQNGYPNIDRELKSDDEADAERAAKEAEEADRAMLHRETVFSRRYLQLRVSVLRALQFHRGQGGLNEFARRAGQWKIGLIDLPGGGQFQAKTWEARHAREAARRGGCSYIEYRVYFPQDVNGLGLLPALLRCLCHAVPDVMNGREALPMVNWVLAHRRERGDGTKKAEWAVTSTRKLLEILRIDSHLREVVCGVDICGPERGTRLDVFRDAYRLVNEHNDEAGRKGWPQIGKAVHAGEDFDSIVSGLRYIDEALGIPGIESTGLFLCPGDRLGHCTALGLDHRKLKGRTYRVPLLTRLQDLAWMRHLASQGHVALRGDDVDRNIRELLANTVAFQAPVEAIVRALLVNPTELAVPADSLGDLLVPHVIDDEELERIRFLQKYVQQRVQDSRLIVESCPTSNLAISELADYRSVPFWGLVKAGIRCTINTDDPGVLGIDLVHEVRSLERLAKVMGFDSSVDEALEESLTAAFRSPR